MPTLTETKTHELVRRLLLATNRGDIEWRESDRPYAYIYSNRNSSAIIASEDDDGSSPFEFQLADSGGATVEGLRTTFVAARGMPNGRRPAPWNKDLAELHDAARRVALNLDSILRDLSEGLPELPPEEPSPEG